eukprot:gene35275-45678_t
MPTSSGPTQIPSSKPTLMPTIKPTVKPSNTATTMPSSSRPSQIPTFKPTTIPSRRRPSASPSYRPTTSRPTSVPSPAPSFKPTTMPSSSGPTAMPSSGPSTAPPNKPTAIPSHRGSTVIPSKKTTTIPSSRRPTQTPSKMTTIKPSERRPTATPSKTTTAKPSSKRPTQTPSKKTTAMPSTAAPSQKPTIVSPADDIQYRGGLVYTGDMKIFNIYYGDFSGNGSQSVGLTNYLAANLGTSSWYNILSSYYSIVNGSRVYVQGSLTFAGSYNLFPTWRGNTTTIPVIKDNVVQFIFNNDIIQPDPYTIYAVIFRGDFTVSTNKGKKWLQDWCGLHSGVQLVSDTKFYPLVFIGDISSVKPADRFNCSVIAPYPNGNQAADSTANMYAHEVAEVITDPILFKGWTFDRGPGRNSLPWENADECAWYFSGYSKVGAKNFSLQQNWQPGEDKLYILHLRISTDDL